MERITLAQAGNAAGQFQLAGEPVGCAPYGNGHINNTFLLSCAAADGATVRYILQAINTAVFRKPEQVIANIERVTDYLRAGNPDPRAVMRLVPTASGAHYYTDGDGRCWRMYDFIEDSLSLDRPESESDFYQSAVAFGRFQRDLNGFPADQLFETIPDFHNTPKRYRDFLAAVQQDVCGRAASVEREIAFLREREDFYSVLFDANRDGRLPLRVTHNDTKLNNVLLDRATRTALCVIDLDTIMPGFSVNDFGDSIRFGANTAAEDEPDWTKASIDLSLFETYLKGYLDGCGGAMEAPEILLLPEGAKMMTIECGMRFLTDYLQGDTYFKTQYPEHNLVRCHTQFRLVADMEQHWDAMKAIAASYTGEVK